MRGCGVVEIPPDVLRGMQALELVYADNPRLCCQDILPAGFNLKNCLAPADEISSCDDLLRSDLYRVVLTVFAVLALLGNLTSFVYRLRLHPSVRKLGFHVFVTQLCVSDFLMGVYLAIIGVADRVYMGRYLWEDVAWKNSIGCQVAGFLSLLSSETSAFTICLITVERFIVIRFPFSRLHFKGTSAYLAVAVAWILGLMLAALPLLPAMAHWRFYSQTGICIPLPITRADFAGHGYSFSVLIVCNLVLFLLIAVGQGLIYWSVLSGSVSVTDTNAKAKDAVIARRPPHRRHVRLPCAGFPSGFAGCCPPVARPYLAKSTWSWPSSCCRSTLRSTLFSTRSTSCWRRGKSFRRNESGSFC